MAKPKWALLGIEECYGQKSQKARDLGLLVLFFIHCTFYFMNKYRSNVLNSRYSNSKNSILLFSLSVEKKTGAQYHKPLISDEAGNSKNLTPVNSFWRKDLEKERKVLSWKRIKKFLEIWKLDSNSLVPNKWMSLEFFYS